MNEYLIFILCVVGVAVFLLLSLFFWYLITDKVDKEDEFWDSLDFEKDDSWEKLI